MELPKFAVLERMARENPEALEDLRQAHIETIIGQSAEANRRRLRGLQFKIDAIRQISSNPMAGCIRISKLMHDSLIELNAVLQSDAAVQARTFLTELNASNQPRADAGETDQVNALSNVLEPVAIEVRSCQVYQMDRFRQARA